MRIALGLVLSWLLAACATAPVTPSGSLVITDVMIASPERDAPYGPTSVRIIDGRIAEIGGPFRAGEGATMLDGAGRYLSPGLIDSHVHLNEIPGLPFGAEETHPDLAAAWTAQAPRSFLYHGFTTLIDLFSSGERVAAWNARTDAPHVHFCGGAPVMDGYPTNFMPAPQRYEIISTFVINSTQTAPEGIDPAAHTPDAVVERIAQDGAICVKTHFESGFGRVRNLPTPSAEILRALRDAAHARGMKLLLHANSQQAHAAGVAGDVDLFVHGMWTWNDRRARELSAEITALLDAEIEADIAVQPTIQVLYGEGDLLDPNFLSRPGLADVYPPPLLAWYATEDGQWFRNEMLQDEEVRELVSAGRWDEPLAGPIARVNAVTRYGASHGQQLLFGSDTPSGPTYANPPGLNGRWEMDRWLATGIEPTRIFRAATIENAAFFGLEDVGVVAIGKQADLLLLRDNPFESVTAFDAIDLVIVDGEPIARETLSARARAD